MSAKDRRKSELVTLPPAAYGALSAYARAIRARSLSAAARQAIRAHLAGAERFSFPEPPTPRPSRALRLQLEGALRAELARRRLATDAAIMRYLSL